MKKFDVLTPIGVIGGLGLVFYGITSGDGGSIKAFIDIPSLAITVGCSFFALLVVYTVDDMKTLVATTVSSFFDTKFDKLELIHTLVELSNKIKREGKLACESDVGSIADEFLRKGLEFVIDDASPETIQMVLKAKKKEEEQAMLQGSKMYKTWGSFAPAFGMVGTLIGLIQMMGDLGNPDDIAIGMAKALITTFYGALFANLVFNPIGFNLQAKSTKLNTYREMCITGILSVQAGESKSILENKLMSYLNSKELTIYIGNKVK